MLAPETLLQSRYLIVRLIAQGGMGAVYEAKDQRLGSTVALKESFFSDDLLCKAFEREARLLANLRHPVLPFVSDHFVEGNGQFLVMQFIAGDDLGQTLEQKGSLFSPEEVLNWADQLLDALDYLHTQDPPIIHRDIKPQNLKLAARSQIILLDFGLAKGSAAGMSQSSAAGSVFGYTPNYAPLEQMQGAGTDPRSDQYSLAATLYYLMTGLTPTDALTRAAALLNKKPDPLLSIDEINPQVKPAIAAVLKRAIAVNREARFDSTSLLRSALRDARHSPTVAYSDNRAESKQLVGSTVLRSSPDKEPPRQSDYATTVVSASGQTETDIAERPLLQTGQVTAARTQSVAEHLLSEMKRYKKGVAIGLTALIIIISAIGLVLYKLASSTQSKNRPTSSLEVTRMTQLTTSGNILQAAIAPDGKYVAYLMDDVGGQSIWLRQVGTSSSAQIVPPTSSYYAGLTFSPDGSHLYYVLYENGGGTSTLYRVSILGGAARKLVSGIISVPAFSPEGKRFAFVRYYPKQSQDALIVANADGSEERRLAIRNAPIHMPSWSPDGRTIACSAGSGEAPDQFENVIEVSIQDGVEKPIGSHRWASVGHVAWLSDGGGLIIVATDRGSGSSQIWELSYPAGEVRRVTNDLNNYDGLDLTADSNSLVTIQRNSIQHTWIVPDGDATRAKQIAPQANTFSWAPDGRLVYEADVGDETDIWIVDVDGRNAKQLTVGAKSNHHPIVSRDGRYIIFETNRTDSSHIWRMDIDGSNPRELTSGNGQRLGDCSPDGQWLVYAATGALWKVSISGGNSVKLADNVQGAPFISPDGKLIACDYWDKQPLTPAVTAVFLFEGGTPVKIFHIPLGGARWSPDGQALLYSDTQGGVSNIWSQPIAGGAATQLTDFKSDQIFWFDWSRDGNKLACSRGVVTRNVVLMSNFK